MASGIDVKMGVSGVSQFKSTMNQSSQSVKTLDAALKLNEKQLQATGDKEAYMTQKSKLLQQQIAAQSNVVKQGQAALQAMEKNGVDPASAAYQKLQQQVLNAQTALLGMQTDLGGVGQTATETAQQTDQLANSLNSINKKVSFDAVLNGIGKITDGMEKAARRVASLATDVWSTMTTAAAWADDLDTQAKMYGMSTDELQQMNYAAITMKTTVDTIVKSRQKLKQSMVSDSDAFKELGVQLKEWGPTGALGNPEWVARNWEDVFWDLGDALLNYGDEVKRDVYAQQLFGKSWMELMPMFKAGREEYEKAMGEADIVSKENVDKLSELNDAIQKLNFKFQTLKTTVISTMAPAFTSLANSISDALGNLNKYLESAEGQEKLQALGDAASKLFEGITNVDFGEALSTAKGWLDGITGALGWIQEHWNDVVTGIKAIGAAFLGLKLAEVVGSLAQGALALKNLMGGGAGNNTQTQTVVPTGGSSGTTLSTILKSQFPGASAVVSGLFNPATLIALFGPGVADFISNPGKYLSVKPEYQGVVEAMEAALEGKTLAEKAADAFAPGYDGGLVTLAPTDVQKATTRRLWGHIFGTNTPSTRPDDETRSAPVSDGSDGRKPTTRRKNPTGVAQAVTPEEKAAVEAAQANGVEAIKDRILSMIEQTQQEIAEGAAQQTAQQAAESPEDKLARLLGFTDDQSIVDSYHALINELLDANKDSQYPWAFGEDLLAQFGLTPQDMFALERMMREAQERLKVPAEPEFDPDVGQQLQDQLSGVELHVTVVPDMVGTGVFSDEGEEDVAWHANGLPFVPFDGYIAALHRGERVLTANQNRSYTTNSNVYFDHVNVGGGVDADGLAARIAERTRRAMSGFGG